jgi:RNase adaptor protein for sRNA GlmZ degradation
MNSKDLSINLIGIVGPCSAGKSTLIRALEDRGYPAKHIAQEHSFVPDMWKRITNPGQLIYLDVSYQTSMRRRPLAMSDAEFEEQARRLRHARQFADLYIDTEHLSPEQVLEQVLAFLEKQ